MKYYIFQVMIFSISLIKRKLISLSREDCFFLSQLFKKVKIFQSFEKIIEKILGKKLKFQNFGIITFALKVLSLYIQSEE